LIKKPFLKSGIKKNNELCTRFGGKTWNYAMSRNCQEIIIKGGIVKAHFWAAGEFF
jgi:hypothetical protein